MSIIIPVTLGSMIEWYEVFLYIYWSPIIESALKIDYTLPVIDFFHASIVFAIAICVSRTFGGVWLGAKGDRKGRKGVFFWTLFFIFLPILLTLFMPTRWVFFSIIYMGLMKFLQGIPAGGELPGALCFLEECALKKRRKYVCSYLLIGPQIGQILALGQSILMKSLLPTHFLVTWGWRLSFALAVVIGCLGLTLRKKLHETSAFHGIKVKHEVLKHPIKKIWSQYKKNVVIGLFLSVFEVAGFFLIEFYFLGNIKTLCHLNFHQCLVLYGVSLVPIVFLMPVIGRLASNYQHTKWLNAQSLLISSGLGVMLLTLPLYFTFVKDWLTVSFSLFGLLIFLLSIQFALIPSLLAEIFPTNVRFTCLGFSFNLTDSLLGGVLPFIAAGIMSFTGNAFAFIFLLPLAAVIFLICLYLIKKLSLIDPVSER